MAEREVHVSVHLPRLAVGAYSNSEWNCRTASRGLPRILFPAAKVDLIVHDTGHIMNLGSAKRWDENLGKECEP